VTPAGTRVTGPWRSLSPVQRRAIRDGAIVAGLIFNAALVVLWLPRLYLFIDAEAWASIDMNNLYGPGEASLALVGAFRYSPAAAWLFLPLSWLPWPLLVSIFTGLSLAALVAMTGRQALLFLLAFPPVLLELINGNISILMAFAIWAGLRWPAAWAFILLTKVTPGVGLLWFVARREWRNLAVALGATAAIVIVGVAIAPALWLEWVRSLTIASNVPTAPGVPPLLYRLPVAAAIAWFAGRTDRAWLVPVAAFVALPILWIQGLAILTASFPLHWERARWQRRGEAPFAPTNAVRSAT
jgi:hypothetical protein